MLAVVLRWTFVIGFFFILGAVMWMVIQIERMKRKQVVESLMTDALQARDGFKKAVDQIQVDIDLATKKDKEDKP